MCRKLNIIWCNTELANPIAGRLTDRYAFRHRDYLGCGTVLGAIYDHELTEAALT
jgi:hypothetical protein